jgi:dimethylargininase
VPLIGTLSGSATADGGDMFWLDDHTLAVGRSYRTNAAAVRQLTDMLAPYDVHIESFDLPHDQGPDYCLHLMSVVSPVRPDVAVVYEPLAPVALMQALGKRGIQVVPLPTDDWLTLGCNVLAVAPGVVVIASGNDATAELLAHHGCEVHVYAASELTKGEGGPTCLTRPILR